MAAVSRGRGAAGRAIGGMKTAIEAPTTKTWAGESDILSKSMRTPFASLLSQVYGKPVELKLTRLSRPHLDASILASVAIGKMQQRPSEKMTQRDLVTKAALAGEDSVLDTTGKEELAIKALGRKPALSSMAAPRFTVRQVLKDLNLKKVTHVALRIAGRFSHKLSADRAVRAVVRNGMTTAGPGTILRQVRKGHIGYAKRAGRTRVGAYGVKAWVGHT